LEALSVLGAVRKEGNVAKEAGVRSSGTAPTNEAKEEPKSNEVENGRPESLEADMRAPTFDGAKQEPKPIE
jgi:hypothetical protein